MKTILGDFSVEYLGVEYSDYFQGFGSEGYENCTDGIGDTEAEALDDCLEMMAQAAGFDFTDKIEERIRRAYGDCDATTTVSDLYDGSDTDEEEPFDGGDERAHFHVGIRWNEKEV
jgi:hypothetical protein